MNVLGQYLMTDPQVGYLVMDVSQKVDRTLLRELDDVPGTIRSRVLF